MARRLFSQGSHPYYSMADPQTPEMDLRLWPLLLNLIDNGQQELTKGTSAQEKLVKNPAVCKIIKTPIDPVYTIVEVKNGLFTISMPLGQDFKPENVDVKVKDRNVIVEIKSDQTSDDGTSQLTQVFIKKVALPVEVKAEDVKSRLTPDGVLKVEAPLPVPEEPAKPKGVDIPVSLEINQN